MFFHHVLYAHRFRLSRKSSVLLWASTIYPSSSIARLLKRGFNSLLWLSVSTNVIAIVPSCLYSSLECFIGESGLGKSTLVNTLFGTILYPLKEAREPSPDTPKTVEVQSISAGEFQPLVAFIVIFSLMTMHRLILIRIYSL